MTRKIKNAALGLLLLGLMGLPVYGCSSDEPPASHTQPAGAVPVKGMVTMVDLGADSCVPCKMMAPIIEKLEKTYRTQIFFDKEGKEVYRHTGFMGEADIVGQLKKMGVG